MRTKTLFLFCLPFLFCCLGTLNIFLFANAFLININKDITPTLINENSITISQTDSTWIWSFQSLNYTLFIKCPNIYYDVVMRDGNNHVIAYSRDNTVYDGDKNIIFYFSNNNVSIVNDPINYWCGFIFNSSDDIMTQVKCNYLRNNYLEFSNENNETIVTASFERNNWILQTSNEIDFRIYGIYLTQISLSRLYTDLGWDGCDAYFTYTSTIIGMCLLFFLLFYVASCCYKCKLMLSGEYDTIPNRKFSEYRSNYSTY